MNYPLHMSRTTARRMGTLMAETIHGCATPEERAGVVAAKHALTDALPDHERRGAFATAFEAQLNKLEPMPPRNTFRDTIKPGVE